MKQLNVSTKYMSRFAGKWVAVDYENDRVVAVGETLQDIAPYVSADIRDKKRQLAAAFKVPYKDEGPYIL